MNAIRMLYDAVPDNLSVPLPMRRRRVEVVFLALDEDAAPIQADWSQGCFEQSAATLPELDGSRALLDAIHHAAHLARTRSLQAAQDLLERAQVTQEPLFLSALEAVLEVLPPSRAFTGFDPAEAVLPSASDFEVLENLRRLAYADRVDKPTQLSLWQTETT